MLSDQPLQVGEVNDECLRDDAFDTLPNELKGVQIGQVRGEIDQLDATHSQPHTVPFSSHDVTENYRESRRSSFWDSPHARIAFKNSQTSSFRERSLNSTTEDRSIECVKAEGVCSQLRCIFPDLRFAKRPQSLRICPSLSVAHAVSSTNESYDCLVTYRGEVFLKAPPHRPVSDNHADTASHTASQNPSGLFVPVSPYTRRQRLSVLYVLSHFIRCPIVSLFEQHFELLFMLFWQLGWSASGISWY